MNFGRCDKCSSFGWLPHACILFECALVEHGPPDWHEVYAIDINLAVEKAAERWDCEGDYTIIKAGESGNTEILVRNPLKPDNIIKYHVYGETVPQYRARRIEPR